MMLFIAALPNELTGLLRRCSGVRKERMALHWARSATLRSGEAEPLPILAVANGMGPIRVRMALSKMPATVHAVCSVGFCGALDPALQAGDIVAATYVNGTRVSAPWASGAAARGTLASVDHIVRTVAEKRRLYASGALAVEMEAATVLESARERRIPCFAIRSVTDLAGEAIHCDFEGALRDDGKVSVSRLGAQAIMHPFTCLPELLRLGMRSARAAERLGEFIAGCEW